MLQTNHMIQLIKWYVNSIIEISVSTDSIYTSSATIILYDYSKIRRTVQIVHLIKNTI